MINSLALQRFMKQTHTGLDDICGGILAPSMALDAFWEILMLF